jgi:hypothetical protein
MEEVIMTDAVRNTIELVQADIRVLEGQLTEKRKMANSLCAMIGQPPLYEVAETATAESAGITSGEFYGQPLAAVVRKILEKRKSANQGPATVAQIHQAMIQGDFAFETDVPENAKRNLRISLTKNSATFHKLPSGKYGLREWYPAIKDKKAGNGKKQADEIDDTEDDAEAFREGFNQDDTPETAATPSRAAK